MCGRCICHVLCVMCFCVCVCVLDCFVSSFSLIILPLEQCPLRSTFFFFVLTLIFYQCFASFSSRCSSGLCIFPYNPVYFCDSPHYCRGLSLFSERVPISLYNTLNLCTLWFWITWFRVSLNLWIKESLDRARVDIVHHTPRHLSWLSPDSGIVSNEWPLA